MTTIEIDLTPLEINYIYRIRLERDMEEIEELNSSLPESLQFIIKN